MDIYSRAHKYGGEVGSKSRCGRSCGLRGRTCQKLLSDWEERLNISDLTPRTPPSGTSEFRRTTLPKIYDRLKRWAWAAGTSGEVSKCIAYQRFQLVVVSWHYFTGRSSPVEPACSSLYSRASTSSRRALCFLKDLLTLVARNLTTDRWEYCLQTPSCNFHRQRGAKTAFQVLRQESRRLVYLKYMCS